MRACRQEGFGSSAQRLHTGLQGGVHAASDRTMAARVLAQCNRGLQIRSDKSLLQPTKCACVHFARLLEAVSQLAPTACYLK